ncbi:hypothetical protein GCM10023153_24690 [Ornithinibacter aureus]|uniref:Uncharacterized protein n=1 Tax=Ornithinibacter aureus TaxID=622664 RepID=A0ABP8K177_9MICO|nr:hypothetical protein [Ornithinibacter aureus]KAF0833079.1 hypothetical protein C8E84_0851 [Ornithinibacter aureus]
MNAPEITVTGYRAGWLVGHVDSTGEVVAIKAPSMDGRPVDLQPYPVAPVVEIDRWHLVVECPACQPRRRGGRPIRHTHGRGDGRRIAEGHRVGHGEACSTPGYVVLLLDPDRVTVKGYDLPEPDCPATERRQ